MHRDIKPANICVEISSSSQQHLSSEAQLRFTIIDLGAAVSIEPVTSDPIESTEGFLGQFKSLSGLKLPLGTVSYMSPEHIDDDRTVDGRSDVFSFGVTMYYCLCRRFPFIQPKGFKDDRRLALKLMFCFTTVKEATPLDLCIGDVHPRAREELTAIVMKSLRKSPKKRYNTACDMRNHVKRIGRYRMNVVCHIRQ